MRTNEINVTLQDILEIENDEEILSFKCPETGCLLWPLIRNLFIRFIKSDLHYDTPLISEKRPARPLKAYTTLFKVCAHNLIKGRKIKGPVLISSTGSHVMKDGRYFNRLSDHFAIAARDQTMTMESLFTDWHWPFPRHNDKVFFDSPILAFSSLYGKFAVKEKHEIVTEALVGFVSRRATELLSWSLSEQRRRFLTATLAKRVASLPVRKRMYAKVFQRTGARILIKEEGCYGGSSIVNSIARECGIVTAEYQHGSVSAGHDAYNFAEALRSSEEYKKTLPQYFLGYGRWWNDQISAPVIKLDIGNPDRTESLKSAARPQCEKKDVIVLGDGIETEKYLSLCTILAKGVDAKYRVVFRPHPMERERTLRLYDGKAGGVAIEWEKGICEAFEVAEIVVSEVSTGLFEAVGLANRIFMWDTPKAKFGYPSHPFATFSDADDLVAKIQDGESGRVDSSLAEELWAPNWKENYLNFLESVCPGFASRAIFRE